MEESANTHLRMNHKCAILLLVLITSAAVLKDVYTARDGRAAKNRQRRPTFHPFNYTSKEEKELFNSIRNLEAKQARTSSHLTFLMKCSAANVYPVKIQHNGSFNVALPDEDIEHQLKEIYERNATEKMNAAISHLKLKH